MKRGRKWIRPGAQITAIAGGHAVGYTIKAVRRAHAMVEVELPAGMLPGATYSSSTLVWGETATKHQVHVTPDEENTLWIRGWHKPDSPALKAFLVAAALRRTA